MGAWLTHVVQFFDGLDVGNLHAGHHLVVVLYSFHLIRLDYLKPCLNITDGSLDECKVKIGQN